ncbi:hypothetical protein BD311DRAFT_763728 [Dichomitus squalens]|nr:hypothetical protein BD311DRAFT_763728 [Dichomitus squalens]
MDLLPGWKPWTEAQVNQEIQDHLLEANDENPQQFIDGTNRCVKEGKRMRGMRVIG